MSTDGQGQDAPAAGPHGAPDPLIGTVLDGRYRIIDKLGEGGMGEVYAAEHMHIRKKVAIKLLRKEIVTNEEAVARFRQEARSASEIEHANIIKIEDFGTIADGRIYLCMELLKGRPLNDIIREGVLPPDRLLDVLIQTGQGLAAAHENGVVHRDMKPENIFVTCGTDGRDVPKLLDFGIAKVSGADGNNHLTRTGTIFGTPFYMAPEQALGQAVDHRADIYAMGIIMYEVFTGSIPFSGESFMGILTKHITAEPMPPSQMAAQNGRVVPPGMEEIIVRAMRKDPDERYQSMDELVATLVAVRRRIAGAGVSGHAEAHRPTQMGHAPLGSRAPMGMPMPMPASAHGRGGAAAGPGPGRTPPPGEPPVFRGPPTDPPPDLSGSGGMPAAAPGSHPYAVTPQRGYGHAASAAHPLAAGAERNSRAGRWVALAALLLLAGGAGAAFYFLEVRGGAGDGGGEVDAALVAVAGRDAGAVPDAGAAPDAATRAEDAAATPADAGAMAASEDAAIAEDAAAAGAAAAAAPEDGGALPPAVRVLLGSDPNEAAIYIDGKRVAETPHLLEVLPGEPLKVVLKKKNYEDAEVLLDGAEDKVMQRLTRKRKSGQSEDSRPDVPFCERPENRNAERCLPPDDCRRRENRNRPYCQLE